MLCNSKKFSTVRISQTTQLLQPSVDDGISWPARPSASTDAKTGMRTHMINCTGSDTKILFSRKYAGFWSRPGISITNDSEMNNFQKHVALDFLARNTLMVKLVKRIQRTFWHYWIPIELLESFSQKYFWQKNTHHGNYEIGCPNDMVFINIQHDPYCLQLPQHQKSDLHIL